MGWNLVGRELLNQDYRGHAEECSYTFSVNKPDQFGAKWTALEHLDAHIQALQDEGKVVLEYKLYEDRSPTLRTDYWCQITASASIIPWVFVIRTVVALLLLWVAVKIINPVIQAIRDIAEYSPVGFSLLAGAALVATIFIGVAYFKKRAPPRKELKTKAA